jgi:hypothetical protein
MSSPTNRLFQLKRSKYAVQAQRIDMLSILQQDIDLLERTKTMKEEKNSQSFFDKLSSMTASQNMQAPGSILPSIPKSSFKGLNTKKEFNNSHRSVGYGAAPCEPWNSLSKVKYARNKNQKLRKKRKKKNRCSPKHKKEITTTPTVIDVYEKRLGKKKSEKNAEVALLTEILKQHKTSINKHHLEVKHNNILYEEYKALENKERRNMLIESMISDADKSIKRVVARNSKAK